MTTTKTEQEHDELLRQRYPLWLRCQHDATRALGRALIEVDSLFNEMTDIYEAGEMFDSDREQADRLISDALALVVARSESAFDYVKYRVPDIEQPAPSAAVDDARRESEMVGR